MATLISKATGIFTDASTWAPCDASAILDSEAGNTVVDATDRRSATFTPSAITVDGIAVKVASCAAPTGTITIRLWNETLLSAVAGASVTVNAADFPLCTTADNNGGWLFVRFASPVTLIVANSYRISVQGSTTTGVALYRNATTDNWSRHLRTDASAAPAATDVLHVMSAWTGAGAVTNFAVSMNNVATTTFGPGTDALPAMTISGACSVTFGTTASTNYYLKLGGNFYVYTGATLNIGTTGTPMPSTSSAVLEFTPVADGGMGLICRSGSICVMQGKPVAACWTTMTADKAAGATTLTVASTAGWAAGDTLGIATTTRTASECDTKTITSVDSATQVTIPALTNAHGGVAPVRAHVVNLTRNVRVRSNSATLMAYVTLGATTVANFDYVEFYYLGQNGVGKRGIETACSTGSQNVQGCALHDFEAGGFYFLAAVEGAGANLVFTNNVLYNCASFASSVATVTVIPNPNSNAPGAWTITNNVTIKTAGAATPGFALNAINGTFTGNVAAGCNGNGLTIAQGNSAVNTVPGTIGNFEAYGNVSNGVGLSNTFWSGPWTIAGVKVWRQNLSGIDILTSFGLMGLLTWDALEAFGNNSANVTFGSCICGEVVFIEPIIDAGVTLSAPYGMRASVSNTIGRIYIRGGTFGDNTPHATADLFLAGSIRFYAIETAFNSAVTVETPHASGVTPDAGVFTHLNDATTTGFKCWFKAGIIEADAVTRHTPSGYAWRMDPALTYSKLLLPGPSRLDTFRAPVANGAAVTISVWVRKGATYNGAAPRLVLVGGRTRGINADVIDSLSVGADTWEQLTVVATPTEDGAVEFYVDCDGTAGSVYVDDVAVEQA